MHGCLRYLFCFIRLLIETHLWGYSSRVDLDLEALVVYRLGAPQLLLPSSHSKCTLTDKLFALFSKGVKGGANLESAYISAFLEAESLRILWRSSHSTRDFNFISWSFLSDDITHRFFEADDDKKLLGILSMSSP